MPIEHDQHETKTQPPRWRFDHHGLDAFEALERLGVADSAAVDAELELLWRLCAMLCRLAQLKRR